MGKVGLYDVLIPIGALAIAPGYLLRSLRHPEYRAHFAERLGRLPPDLVARLDALPRRPVWMQAVSVGEVMLARTLLGALQRRLAAGAAEAPAPRVALSSTTPAGRQAAAGAAMPLVEGVFHFPVDWAPFVGRTLDAVRPSLFISLETEIWPALLGQCARRGLPALIVNGRISVRSHGRYLRLRGMLREPLRAVRLACMQSEPDADRARSIGIPADRVVVAGNMKFDAPVPDGEDAGAARARFGFAASGPDRILVAGSTSPGEEEIVLDAVEGLRRSGADGVSLALAPRHPERFDDVARLLARRGVVFRRRSEERAAAGAAAAPGPAPGTVLLLDTVGELAGLYAAASAAFVGGSLVPRGGQNLIEPAARGVPVLFGRHTENFASIAGALVEAGAGFRVAGAADLESTLRRLLSDEEARRRAGAAGRALIERHRGATERTVDHILPFLGPGPGRDGVRA